MAEAIQIFGKTEISTATPSATGTVTELGTAIDMIEPEERVFLHNVPSDAHGGPQGPPVEVQWLGQMAIIPIRMSVWDSTQVDILRKGHHAALGVIADGEIGSLLFGDGTTTYTGSHRLLLNNTGAPINFTNCIIREPISASRGTKFSECNIIFEAHRAPPGHSQAGKIWTSDTGAYV